MPCLAQIIAFDQFVADSTVAFFFGLFVLLVIIMAFVVVMRGPLDVRLGIGKTR